MVDSGGDSMADRLENVERTLSTLKTTVDERFVQVDQRFERMERLIRSEGDKTRRHFDVVAEQMKAERNLVLDLGLASAERVARLYAANVTDRATIEATLRDHEVRLRELEQRVDSE